MLRGLLEKNRSYRRFYQDVSIPHQELVDLIENARLSPSARNLQPLKYLLVHEPKVASEVFTTLGWAGYLKEWSGPTEGERPAAYIIIVGDTSLTKQFGCDHGIASQSILLGAVEKGYGGCLIGALKRDKLRAVLEIAEQYEILLVVALGKPKEQVVLEEVENDNIEYYRDAKQFHHVPKRSIAEIIINK